MWNFTNCYCFTNCSQITTKFYSFCSKPNNLYFSYLLLFYVFYARSLATPAATFNFLQCMRGRHVQWRSVLSHSSSHLSVSLALGSSFSSTLLLYIWSPQNSVSPWLLYFSLSSLHLQLFFSSSVPSIPQLFPPISLLSLPSCSLFVIPLILLLWQYSLQRVLPSSLNGPEMLLSFIWICLQLEAHSEPRRKFQRCGQRWLWLLPPSAFTWTSGYHI